MKNSRKKTLAILALIIFIVIGVKVKASQEGILFDERIMDYIHGKATLLGIDIMRKVTYFGSVYFFLPIGLIIFFYMLRKRDTIGVFLLILSTLGSYGLNYILKNIFIRTRPLKYFLIEQGGYSFPSGHAMVSMTFYTTMTYLLIRKINKKETKVLLKSINFLTIVLIGFSRIYLGVHWPTDVLMGYLIGYLFYIGMISLIPKE
ncbi:phosphatase PAP2 family protein [Clostridium sp. Cult3]|uniref:phosphatase PAP2 family protein n=1 Tax=Clostridium sp. Cult3 TaxID=2079004 RepID=UPI001F39516D|nr:phosphatase PAP2 family protein [Clostridium sp. Cult3]MCF6459972.1 phospholipid phosphatase [Clostridium sp. Cult3]